MDENESTTRRRIDLLTEAIAAATVGKDLTQLYIERGHCYELLGDAVSSASDFLSALDTAEISSDIVHIKSMIALALAKRDEKEQALFWAMSAVEHDSHNPEAQHTLGLVCNFSGFLNLAIEALRAQVDLDPQRWDAIRVLGSCLRENGRVNEAIEKLSSYVTNNPNDQIGLFELGWSFHICPGENNLHRAKEFYERALTNNPDSNLKSIIQRKLQDIHMPVK